MQLRGQPAPAYAGRVQGRYGVDSKAEADVYCAGLAAIMP